MNFSLKKTTKLDLNKSSIGFGNEDSEDSEGGDCNQDIKRASLMIMNQKNNSASMQLLDDASVYDYDGNYDQDKYDTAGKKINNKNNDNDDNDDDDDDDDGPKSRYITGLLSTARHREKIKEIQNEKKIMKEQAAESGINNDDDNTPKFITAAYKQTLLDRDAFEAQEEAQEKIEQSNDVRKVGMSSFYGNIIGKELGISNSNNTSNAISNNNPENEKMLKKKSRFDIAPPPSTLQLLTTSSFTQDVLTESERIRIATETKELAYKEAEEIRIQERDNMIAQAKERYFARKALSNA